MEKHYKLLASVVLRMTEVSGRSKRIVLFVLIVMLLLGGFYWLSVNEKEQYLVQRNFRLLNMWSQAIAKKVESYKKVSELAFEELNKDSLEKLSDIPDCSRIEELIKDPNSRLIEELIKDLNSRLILQTLCKAGLKRITIKKIGNKNDPESSEEPKRPVNLKTAANSIYSFQLAREENKLLIRFQYSEQDKQFSLYAEADLSAFIIDLTSEKVFKNILLMVEPDDEEESDTKKSNNLAQKPYGIIYQKNSIEYSWRKWSDVVKPIPNDSWLDYFLKTDNPKTKKAAQDSVSLQQAPHIVYFQVPHGEEYAIFSQPVRFSSAEISPVTITIDSDKEIKVSTDSGRSVYISGIIPVEELRVAYLAVSSTTLLIIMTALLGLLLAIPLIRLKMMGPTDALKSLHICILFFSMSLSAGLLTILFLDISIIASGKNFVDEKMEQSALNIKQQMKRELTSILQTLQQYDVGVKFKEDIEHFKQTRRKIEKESTDQTIKLRPNFKPCNKKTAVDKNNDMSSCYPDYSYAFWVDQEGMIRVNWVTPGTFGYKNAISVRKRKYVSTVLETPGNLWHIHEDKPKKNFNFFVQPITSWSTGINKVVASMRSSTETGWVAAMQFQFLSLMKDVVTPPGVGFAVVNNQDYGVLFHSRQSRAMTENFLVETDHNPLLRDLIQVGESGHIEGRYWGADTHFYVLPLEDVPWTLIMYRDKELLSSVSLVMLVMAGGMFTFWTLVLLFGLPFLIGWVFQSDFFRDKKWLWPDSTYHAFYQYMIIFNSLVFFCCLVAYRLLSATPGILLLTVLLIVPVYIFVTYSRKGMRVRKFEMPCCKGLSCPMSYGLMISSFLFVFSVLPAVGIMNVVYQKEMSTVIKHQLLGLHQALNKTDKPLVKFSNMDKENFGVTQVLYQQAESDENNDKELETRYGLLGFYPDFLFSSTWLLKSDNSDKSENSHKEIKHNINFFDELYQKLGQHFIPLKKGIESWGLLNDSMPDKHVRWETVGQDVKLHGLLRARTVDSSEPKYSPPTEINFEDWKNHIFIGAADISFRPFIFGGFLQSNHKRNKVLVFVLNIILFFTLVGLVCKIPLYVANRTMFLFRPRRSNQELPLNLEKLIAYNTLNLLIVGYPGQGKTQKIDRLVQMELAVVRLNKRPVVRLNMKNVPAHVWFDYIKDREAGRAASIVIIDQFEFRCNEPVINQKKLDLLEKLFFQSGDVRRHVHIVSNVYPGIFPLSVDASVEEDKHQKDELIARWNTLWEAFSLTYYNLEPKETGQCLRDIWLDKEIELNNLLPGNVQKKMREDFLRPHYQAIWQSVTLDEQLALFHLVRDRFIHHKHPGLNSLLCKGLIKFDPYLCLMDERFESFVKYVGRRDQLEMIENKHKDSRWQIIRMPLVVGFVIFFLF